MLTLVACQNITTQLWLIHIWQKVIHTHTHTPQSNEAVFRKTFGRITSCISFLMNQFLRLGTAVVDTLQGCQQKQNGPPRTPLSLVTFRNTNSMPHQRWAANFSSSASQRSKMRETVKPHGIAHFALLTVMRGERHSRASCFQQ